MGLWLKRGVYGIAGAAAGYAYYHFIGCATGTCPISSNPYLMTGYGALVGLILALPSSRSNRNPGER